MSNYYMNLGDYIPGLRHPGYPTCDGCEVEVDGDGDGWLCPSCGTAWDGDNLEYGEGEGTRFEDWSGETRTGPIPPRYSAWCYSGMEPDERDRNIRDDNERGTK